MNSICLTHRFEAWNPAGFFAMASQLVKRFGFDFHKQKPKDLWSSSRHHFYQNYERTIELNSFLNLLGAKICKK